MLDQMHQESRVHRQLLLRKLQFAISWFRLLCRPGVHSEIGYQTPQDVQQHCPLM